MCKKRLLIHSVSLTCHVCKLAYHIACVSITKKDHKYLKDKARQWYCITCNIDIFVGNFHDDDDEFRSALYDIFSNIPLTFDDFNAMVFNPFSLNAHPSSPLHDVDSDIQFYNEMNCVGRTSSQYFLEDGFNETLTK